MGRRRGDDPIDVLCRAWGRTRRQVVGLDDPREAKEYIGAIRSTLGAQRDLHAGAKSTGRVEQHYPEVYPNEDQRLVNAAFHAMSPDKKITMDVHYAASGSASRKAEFLCISEPAYWLRVRSLRAFVEGWITARSGNNLNIHNRPL